MMQGEVVPLIRSYIALRVTYFIRIKFESILKLEALKLMLLNWTVRRSCLQTNNLSTF